MALLTVVLMAIHVASENTWQQLSSNTPGLAPSLREKHTAVWRRTGGMLVFGGYGRYGRLLNDLYLYNQESQWQQLSPSGSAPIPRYSHSAVWRTETGGMLVFGGHDNRNVLSDLYLFADQAEESRWQQLSPSGAAPTPRSSHSAVWCTGKGGMLVFGGWGAGELNDLYLYLDKENRWQQLSPSGTAPTPRYSHSAVWRTGTGGMLVFGGKDSNGELNDLYLYLDKENHWQLLSPSGTLPTPRYGHSAVRTESGGMLLFGGKSSGQYLGDLHLHEENQWLQLSPNGTGPTPRYRHSAVWRTGTGGMLVFGGYGAGFLNDLHLYVDADEHQVAPEVDPVDQKVEDTMSAGLLIAVASVLTCLLASLGIVCWLRARKRPGPVTPRQVPPASAPQRVLGRPQASFPPSDVGLPQLPSPTRRRVGEEDDRPFL